MLTGGAGFIASHVVRLLYKKYSDYKVRLSTPAFASYAPLQACHEKGFALSTFAACRL